MFKENDVIGPYVLVRRLGQGGFGEVWLGERRGKFVTTKLAIKLPLLDQVDQEMIRLDAVNWEKVSGHPNVLPILDADEYDGQVVIVSEFAPDGSLLDLLTSRGGVEAPEAIDLTIKVLDGLQFLHGRMIIHRDLKPANILLQGSTPRLADFGISRALKATSSTVTRSISGTFAYMAPEAFDGVRSVQTDVWSVGVTLYQLLTGRVPFPQTEPSALLAAILMREPDPLPDSVNVPLRHVIATALAKDPTARYASAAAMREQLFGVTKWAERVAAPPRPASERIRKAGLVASDVGAASTEPSSVGPAGAPEAVELSEAPELLPPRPRWSLIPSSDSFLQMATAVILLTLVVIILGYCESIDQKGAGPRAASQSWPTAFAVFSDGYVGDFHTFTKTDIQRLVQDTLVHNANAAKNLADPTNRRNQMDTLRQLLTFANEAVNSGMVSTDATVKNELENIRNEVLAVEFEKLKYPGVTTFGGSVTAAQIDEFKKLPAYDSAFNAFLATKIEMLRRSNRSAPSTVTDEERSQAADTFTRTRVLAKQAAADSSSMSAEQAGLIELKVRLQQAQFLSRAYLDARVRTDTSPVSTNDIRNYKKAHSEDARKPDAEVRDDIIRRKITDSWRQLADTNHIVVDDD